MVAEHDDFVGNGAVDDANHVPQRRCYVVLLIDEVQRKPLWRRTDVVFDALVVEAAAVPGLGEG